MILLATLALAFASQSLPELLRAKELNQRAAHNSDQGRLADAASLYRMALDIERRELGPNDLEVAKTLNTLQDVLVRLGNLREAEPLCRQALTIRETALGPHDTSVAISLNNLAEILRATNRYTAADPLYNRAVAILEKSVGPDHVDVGRV